MEFVRQIDKYTLATTKELTPDPVYYSVDNITPGKIHCINRSLLYFNPTLKNLEAILASIEHDCNNLEKSKIQLES